MEVIEQDNWDVEEDNVELVKAKSFKDMVPAKYKVTPLRIIMTKHGKRLILELQNTKCEKDTFQAFAPATYFHRLQRKCGDHEHIHGLNYKGLKTIPGKTYEGYDYIIVKLPGNPVTITSSGEEELYRANPLLTKTSSNEETLNKHQSDV